MSGSVKEGDVLLLLVHVNPNSVGANGLRDATSLTSRYLALADCVQQGGLQTPKKRQGWHPILTRTQLEQHW